MAHNRESDTLDLSEVQDACKNIPTRRTPTSRPASPRRTAQPAARPDPERLWDYDDLPTPRPPRQTDSAREHAFDFDLPDAPRASGKADSRPASARARGGAQSPHAPGRKSGRKRHGFLKFLLVILAILAAAVITALLLATPPQRDTQGLGSRTGDTVNVLIAGTDQEGARTDTIMLVSIHKKDRHVTLTSIPRDTLVENVYESQRINSVYGFNGEGEAGIEALMAELTEIFGVSPDGYALVDLTAFIDLVDIMGGVWFDVPQDMQYTDPTQDLYIDLTAGPQRLDGQHAMQLVRFRSYAMADLQRVNVQRDFIQAALHQWLSVKGLVRAPQVLKLMQENVQTDLSVRNMIWLAAALKQCMSSEMTTQTLPGTPDMIGGASYYVLDRQGVVDTVNASINPYETPVTTDRVTIKDE